MAGLLWRTVGACTACGGFYLLTHKLLGPLEWVLLALVIGLAFSRIVIDASAEFGWHFRSLLLKPMEGNHYKFQNFTVHVIEDDDHCRWIATHEIRTIVGNLATDHALAKIFPSGHRALGKNGEGYLRDDALVAHLANATSAQGIKFKNWVERNVAFPARRIRKRLGIVLPAPSAAADE
ncbi:MAG: hypothetical protein NTU86_02265 [Burkholderiales bacterium]|nr:hypothetical protein [Burkholderiales bacterium]